jgi:signal transduction histidine kinase
MKPLTLRAKLTLSYSIIVSLLLTGFALLYYRVLSVDLDQALNDDLIERASGLRGYLRFEDGKPVFIYDDSDSDEAFFVRSATRYFQIYDVSTGELLGQSPELETLGVQYSGEDIDHFAQSPRSIFELQTDQGKLRFRTETITIEGGHTYLLIVGASTQAMDNAIHRFLRSLAWLIPTGVFLAAITSWFMAGKAWQPIEQTIQQMKQFTASISHELRTPLAVLRGEAEVALMQSNSAEQYRRVLASQLEEFDKLSRMVNQLLTLARAESGEVAIARDPLDFSDMAQSIAEQLEPVAASKGVRLAWHCDPDVIVVGDAAWIERIVLNIVDNAIKFTPESGHVAVRVSKNARQATFEVLDDGIGISPEDRPHVFDRFYRADVSRSHATEGAGLGLSLVKWAVDQHGGSVEIDSAGEKGTRVTVHLPVQH